MSEKRASQSYSVACTFFALIFVFVSCVQSNFDWNAFTFLPAQEEIVIHWDFDELVAEGNYGEFKNLANSQSHRGLLECVSADPMLCENTDDLNQAGTAVFTGLEYVESADPVDIEDEFTVSFWIYPTHVPDGSGHALAYMGNASSWWQISYLLGTERVCLIFDGVSVDHTGACFADTDINVNQWQHIAFSVRLDSVSPQEVIVRSYLNGRLQEETNPIFLTKNLITNGQLFLGAKEGNNYLYKGKIDNFVFWDSELSADEMCQLYEQQSGGSTCGNGPNQDSSGGSVSNGNSSSSAMTNSISSSDTSSSSSSSSDPSSSSSSLSSAASSSDPSSSSSSLSSEASSSDPSSSSSSLSSEMSSSEASSSS